MLHRTPGPPPPQRGLFARIALRTAISLSAAGAILSATLNIATYFSDTICGLPLNMQTWRFLHITAFVLCGFAILLHARNIKRFGRPGTLNFRWVPAWARVIAVLVVIYTVVNIITFTILMHDGAPNRIGGKPVLSEHGRVTRPISEAEFLRYEAYELRGFSGQWMLAHTIAALMYLRLLRPQR